MGKKKSVALMILITVVTVALSLLTIFPSFNIPFLIKGLPKTWNPVVLQYDLGADYGGGYYAYYYPEGVITESDYDSLSAESKEDYVEHKGLYLSTDPDFGIFETDEDGLTDADVSADFKAEFAATAEKVAKRYVEKGYSDYCVSVVDDYSIRVNVPKTETNAKAVVSVFAFSNELTVTKGDAEIEELKDKALTDYVKEFTYGSLNGYAFVQVKLTKAGKDLVNSFKAELSSASGGTSASATTLNFAVGEEKVVVYADHINANTDIKVPVGYDNEISNAQTLAVLLQSTLENGALDVTLKSVSTDSIVEYGAPYGENTLLLTYIALAVCLLACIVLPIVFFGRYGVTCAYSTLGYLIIAGICFAFITPAAFEFSLGTVAIFLLGLVLVNVLNVRAYCAIKSEFALGKTVQSSVKAGMKQVCFETIDVYAVLVIGALAALIGVAGATTLAVQALICFVAGAFLNLLWHRLINLLMLSASTNKYKYFRFVREEDEDDE